MLHNLLNWLDHNRWIVAGLIVTVLGAVWLVGCPATTMSVLRPGEKVNAQELQREAVQVDGLVEQLALATEDIAAKNARRAQMLEIAGGVGQAVATGTVNPASGVAALFQLGTVCLAGGAILNGRRKDAVIKKLKNS